MMPAEGTLDHILCLICGQHPRWQKVNFHRESDGAFDWRLEVRCDCGEITDAKVLDQAEADYRHQYRRIARLLQDAILDHFLSPQIHAFFK